MKLTVMLIDNDYRNVGLLAEALQKSSRIETVLIATDAEGALAQARKAGFIVMDPMLPGMDGVALLRQLLLRNLRPGVIALSSFYSRELLEELNDLSVMYCMYKPVDINFMLRRIESWYEGQGTRLGGQKQELRRQISAVLHELGMAPLSGYYDCCSAIEWLCAHPHSRGRITKEMYPLIARSTAQTLKQVERNIRYVIERTWVNGDREALERYFGYAATPDRSRPTNAAFLRTIAEYLRQSGAVPDESTKDIPEPVPPEDA